MNKTLCCFYLLLTVLLTGCSSTSSPIKTTRTKTTTQSLSQLEALSSGGSIKTDVSTMRTQVLQDTALSVGARGGLAWRGRELNNILLNYESSLNRAFNFNGMILDDNVLPPVLLEGRNTLNLTGSDIIRIADRNYQILSQAKFVTAAPHWRDYLWMKYHSPELPHKSLLPRNKAERVIWKKFIQEGWQAGLTQADLIFKENIARLMRDYQGMIRYRKLLAQNMVSPPYVATLDLGITGDGSNLTVNDRVLRITAFPSLQANGEQWKTEIREYE